MRGKPTRIPSRSTVRTGPWGAAQEPASSHYPGVLTFSYNTETSSVTKSSPNAKQVLGVSPQHLSVHGALFLAYVHPADRFTTEVLLDTALRNGTPYVATYRWIRPDSNEVRFIHCRACRDPATKLFSGMMIDLTSETPKLRGEGEMALAIGELLTYLGISGLTLDLELTIRSVTIESAHYPLSFGGPVCSYEALRRGASLLDCFKDDAAKRAIAEQCEALLAPNAQECSYTVDGFQTILRPLVCDSIPHGIIIYTLDRRSEAATKDHVAALEQELLKFSDIKTYRPAIAAATQEIAGYSALITRHSRGNPLLAAISDSLFQSIRELAATTDRLNDPSLPSLSKPPGRLRKRKTTPASILRRQSSASIIFSSHSPRCATSHALLLRESGFACATCELEETALVSLLRASDTINVIILDAPTHESSVIPLVRRIKREAPKVAIVCLATQDDGLHGLLHKAGAVAVLIKPATPKYIEKVVKTLLELKAAALAT